LAAVIGTRFMQLRARRSATSHESAEVAHNDADRSI
jgi:hypothetical protein